MDELR